MARYEMPARSSLDPVLRYPVMSAPRSNPMSRRPHVRLPPNVTATRRGNHFHVRWRWADINVDIDTSLADCGHCQGAGDEHTY